MPSLGGGLLRRAVDQVRARLDPRPVREGGQVFRNKREAARWWELRTLEKVGVITALQRQVAFPLSTTGKYGGRVTVGTYVADFVYYRPRSGPPTNLAARVVEEVTGGRTDLDAWKRHHFTLEYGQAVEEG